MTMCRHALAGLVEDGATWDYLRIFPEAGGSLEGFHRVALIHYLTLN